jgi:hypothetical protein
MSDPQLDVRAEPPASRHGLIFEAYDRLVGRAPRSGGCGSVGASERRRGARESASRGGAEELASVLGRRPPDGGRPDRCR